MSEVELPQLVLHVLPSTPSARAYAMPVHSRVASGAFKAFRNERGGVPGPPFHCAFPEIRSSTSGERQLTSGFGFVGYLEVDCSLPAGAFGGTAAPSVTILCKPKSAAFCCEEQLCVRATTSSVPTVRIGNVELVTNALRTSTSAFFQNLEFQQVCNLAGLDVSFGAPHAESAFALVSDRQRGLQCTSVAPTRQYCASLGRFVLLCNPPAGAARLGAHVTVVTGGTKTERDTTRPYRLTLACASDRTRQRQVTLWPSDAAKAFGSEISSAQLIGAPMLLLVSGTPPDTRGRTDYVVRALMLLSPSVEPAEPPVQPETVLARVEAATGRAVSGWPPHYATAATAARIGWRAATHQSGVGRLGLTLFCLHNGVPPSLYVEWLRERGCVKADAHSEIRHAVAKLSRGEPLGTTWDLHERQAVAARLPQSSHADVPAALAALTACASDGGAILTGSSARPPPPPGCTGYYARLYPFESVAQLLHRPAASSPFPLRELAIDRCVLRSRPVLSLGKWRSSAQLGAASLHVGPAYAADTQVARLDGGPLGTELVLELDELPAGVEEAARWVWMRHATEVTLHVLREWFGVTNIFGFASGNRGPHLWLLDDAVLQHTRAERAAFFACLACPWEHEGWRELAEGRLLPFYRSIMTDDAAPTDVELARLAYPTFDRAVATDPAHLHRLPFSVNEKTGRVAVPFALSPPFEGLPRGLEDMPRVDDPQLRSRLETPLGVLRAALRSSGDGIADVPPVADAPWSRRGARKRKERSPDATADLPVAPLRIDAAATVAWLEALRGAAVAATVLAVASVRARSVAERSQREGKDWRARLRREADAVEKLVTALGLGGTPPSECGASLRGETYTNGDGRTLTHYPQLDEAQYVARLAKESRHAVTADAYAEVDLAAAHLAGAWGACERHFGASEATARRCPSLQLAATDKHAARALVVSQRGGWTKERAKRAIAAALNQELGDGVARCAFLESLVAERAHMAEAMRAHPAVAGAPLESIRRRCEGHAKPEVRELSLMLQTLEAAVVRCAVGTLDEHGFEAGAFLADGLLVRSKQGVRDNAALERALGAVTAAVGEALGVGVIMECEKWWSDASGPRVCVRACEGVKQI